MPPGHPVLALVRPASTLDKPDPNRKIHLCQRATVQGLWTPHPVTTRRHIRLKPDGPVPGPIVPPTGRLSLNQKKKTLSFRMKHAVLVMVLDVVTVLVALLNSELTVSLHNNKTMVWEFSDVFSKEVPAGLPPLGGIEHQIDLIPGASLPNRAPYRTNPEETKEIQKQVQALLDKDMASSINFNQFLEKEKLKSNGSNFTDWFRHVRIFLNGGNLQYVLDAPLGDPPAETETDEVKNVYMTRKTRCMMEEGSSISEHMLVMTGHAKKLSDLGIVIPNRLGINRVLQSLPPSYKNFVMNYNMQNMNKEFPELFGMLKAAEIEIKKEHQVLMVNKTTSFKKQGKSKGKNKKSGKKAAHASVKPKSALSLMLSAITARRRDTGSVIAPSIWRI
ncbi:hypothetical protein QYE76_070699 [Lolium multiflorum]|uniref:Uncharacterized protein n=1 Tax=Lolium multiflorum TaxID=4521 RepID=A0AAD8WG41_LOLMU|nr:hypothetical protein QYE76_070699 [Lolium multiflorum]